ncbi:MAG: outer membrane beta-barrel protein [Steroidobacteraceae bacterium]|jgi:OOP family OmpA-OmpF porin|nr:outer membrane beta-barrel protein [Steroidobacteraceae bacterium]
MRKSVPAGLLVALALAASPAIAADNGIYLGAGVGASGIEDDEVDFDADATGYKVIAGWRFLDWLAVEGNYVDFGSADDTVLDERIEAEADGLSLSALVFLPIGPVDLFGRVGVVDWSADVSSVSFGDFDDDGTDLTYGVGAQFRLGSLGLRAEYERFELGDSDVDMISVGVTWTFF